MRNIFSSIGTRIEGIRCKNERPDCDHPYPGDEGEKIKRGFEG
jgi:hypothetical protein